MLFVSSQVIDVYLEELTARSSRDASLPKILALSTDLTYYLCQGRSGDVLRWSANVSSCFLVPDLIIVSTSTFLLSKRHWFERRSVAQVDLTKYDTVLLPLCRNNHWLLLEGAVERGQLVMHDSMGKGDEHAMHTARDYLQQKTSRIWTTEMNTRSPQQMNGYD